MGFKEMDQERGWQAGGDTGEVTWVNRGDGCINTRDPRKYERQ